MVSSECRGLGLLLHLRVHSGETEALLDPSLHSGEGEPLLLFLPGWHIASLLRLLGEFET